MRWIALVACLALSGCELPEPEPPQHNAHVEEYVRQQQPERSCTAGMKFGGGMGIALGGCGVGPVLGFDGKIKFGFGF